MNQYTICIYILIAFLYLFDFLNCMVCINWNIHFHCVNPYLNKINLNLIKSN